MNNDTAAAIRTVDLHKYILLVLTTFTIKIEKTLKIWIEVVLTAVDETLSSIETHLQVLLGIAT